MCTKKKKEKKTDPQRGEGKVLGQSNRREPNVCCIYIFCCVKLGCLFLGFLGCREGRDGEYYVFFFFLLF